MDIGFRAQLLDQSHIYHHGVVLGEPPGHRPIDLERLWTQADHDLLTGIVHQTGSGIQRDPIELQTVFTKRHPSRLTFGGDRPIHEVHRRGPNEPGHKQVGGPVVKIAGSIHLRQIGDLLARDRFEYRHPVTHRHRLNLIMGHIQRGGLQTGMQLAQLRTHLHPQLGVKVRKRLIHQKRGRFPHNRPTHRHPLPLPTRQRLRLTIQKVGDLQHLSGLIHPPLNLRFIHLPKLQTKRHIVKHGHMRIQRIILEHHGNIAVLGRHIVHHPLTDLDRPLGDLLQTRQHPQQRRLPTPRRTNQHHKLAIIDL